MSNEQAPSDQAPNDKTEMLEGGEPAPRREQPVDAILPGHPEGERQDGPGIAPRQQDRSDAEPAGSTAARRLGTGADPLAAGAHGPAGEEPDTAHRGQPALFGTGAASGSGSGAGGGGTGAQEEPAADSAGGGGRGPNFAAAARARGGR